MSQIPLLSVNMPVFCLLYNRPHQLADTLAHSNHSLPTLMYPTVAFVAVDAAASLVFNNPWAQISGPGGSQPVPQTSYISEVSMDAGPSDSSGDSSDETSTGKGKRGSQPNGLVRSRSKVYWHFSLSLRGLIQTLRISHKSNALRYPAPVAKSWKRYVSH